MILRSSPSPILGAVLVLHLDGVPAISRAALRLQYRMMRAHGLAPDVARAVLVSTILATDSAPARLEYRTP